MGIIIGGIILIGLAGLLWYFKRKSEGKLHHLEITDVSLTSNVIENYKSLLDTYGPGSFSLYVELKGTAFSEQPLKSEFSEQDSVYYKAVVTREYEELQITKNSDGTETERWVKKSDVVSSHSNTAHDFAVKDDSGIILVDPDSADIHTKKTYSHFESGSDPGTSRMNVSLGGYSLKSGPKVKTIGFKYEEYSIPVGHSLFVAGDANDRSGRLMVSKPQDKEMPFIVSVKSEDEIIKGLGNSVTGLKIGAIVALVAGAGTLIYGLYTLIIGK